VIGRYVGYSNFQDSIQDFIFDYLRDKFLKKLNIQSNLVIIIETVMNLSGWNIVEIILKKYGFSYLVNYIFYLSLIV